MLRAAARTKASLAAIAVVLLAREVRADCASEFEEAQRARNADRLISAEEHAGACAASACPAWLQERCTSFREDLRARVPTIAVRAVDATGKDVERADLTLDGAAIGDRVDGRPIRIDPGAHTLVLGGPCVVRARIVVAEGERDRVVTLACPAAPPPEKAPDVEDERAARRTRTVALFTGGAGLIALGLGAYFGVRALDGAGSMRETCPGPPTCYAGDARWQEASAIRADVLTRSTVADIALAVGLVGVAVGTYLFVRSMPAKRPAGG